MDNDLQYLLNFFFVAYLCLAFVKLMLCAHSIPRAVGVLSRLAGAQRGQILTRYVFLVPLLVLGVALFGWLGAMYRERFGFFSFYSDYRVAHDCVSAYRAAHADDQG